MARAVGKGKLFATVSLAACGVAFGLLAGGCGEAQRNGHEAKLAYTVEVLHARFPAKQAIAKDTTLSMLVHNAGGRTIPNVAVTVDSFSYASNYPGLAARKRPLWIVNTGPGAVSARPVQGDEVNPPGGGGTAFVNTWALGPLAPGKSRLFVWHVSPVKAGVYTIHYTVAAALDGNARARLAGGGAATGSFVARVAPKPPATHVNPETGQIATGPNPAPVAPQPAVP